MVTTLAPSTSQASLPPRADPGRVPARERRLWKGPRGCRAEGLSPQSHGRPVCPHENIKAIERQALGG